MDAAPIHIEHMRRCLALAAQARARGDAPVGSLVARGEQVLGEGVEGVRALNDPAAHAELEAVRATCRVLGTRDLSGTALYTTAEPCFMCSYVIRQARIALVVMGVPIPFVGGVTSAHPILTDAALGHWSAPPRVLWGVLGRQCEALRRTRACEI